MLTKCASEFVSGSIGISLSKEKAITFQSLLFTVLWPVLSICHCGFNILNTDYGKEGYRKWQVEKDYLCQDIQGLWDSSPQQNVLGTHILLAEVEIPGILQVSATNWHLPSASTRIEWHAAQLMVFNTPQKEFRVESRNEAFCAWGWGEGGPGSLQIVRCFQDFVSPILVSLHIQKGTKILLDDCSL